MGRRWAGVGGVDRGRTNDGAKSKMSGEGGRQTGRTTDG